MKIYGIRNCDTMKKAFALLDKRGAEDPTEARTLALLEQNKKGTR